MSKDPDYGKEAWSYAKHHSSGLAGSFDTGLAQWLVSFVTYHMPEGFKALDFGCGLGMYLETLHGMGASKVIGIEPLNMKSQYAPNVDFLKLDIFRDPELALKMGPEEFDFVLCLEVAEHLPEAFHHILFDFITGRSCNYLLFSAATPGQGGDGHISERPEIEWRAEIQKRNFMECAKVNPAWGVTTTNSTEQCREKCKFPWFKKNIMLFQRIPF